MFDCIRAGNQKLIWVIIMNFDFLTGHESFYPREGWLTKGITAIEKNPDIFNSARIIDAIDALGIGANMVKSLRYWLLYFGLANNSEHGQNLQLSNLGRVILEKDLFIQHRSTLWLLHTNSIANAPLWDICCKNTEMLKYSKDYLLQKLESLVKSEGDKSYSAKTCASYIEVFVSTYVKMPSLDVEGNLQSPLSRLKLLNYDGKDVSFRSINAEEIAPQMIFYILFCKSSHEKGVDLESAYNECRSFARMDLTSFRCWLRDLERTSFISIDRAAGLNMIYAVKKISADDMVNELLRVDNE